MSIERRLFSLYAGLTRARGRNSVQPEFDENNKRKSKNQTLSIPYTEDSWRDHLSGRDGLGVVPITDDNECKWGAIDIDIYPLNIEALEQQVLKLDIPMVVLRTKSGGAHLTMYFDTFQSCKNVRAKMAEISFALGLGNREIYPKQVQLANNSDIGNWLNMPYFRNPETDRYAIKNGQKLSVVEFLDYAESLLVSDVTKVRVSTADSALDDGPPCLQHIVQKKAGPGERNNVLFNFGVYCRLKWESEWEQQLEKSNVQYIEPPLSHKEVGSILKSLEKKSYSFTCNNPPLSNSCNREICKQRQFGISAFQHIDIGIVLDSITKLTSDPPMWIVSLDGVRTEIETDDLLDQNRFRRVCTNAINKLPGRMKNEEWDKFIRNKLTLVEILEAPKETKPKEHALSLVPEYFKTTPAGKTIRDVHMGRWVVNGSGYVISGESYAKFLERFDVKIDRRKMWLSLLEIGAQVDETGLWHVPFSAVPELTPTGSTTRKALF